MFHIYGIGVILCGRRQVAKGLHSQCRLPKSDAGLLVLKTEYDIHFNRIGPTFAGNVFFPHQHVYSISRCERTETAGNHLSCPQSNRVYEFSSYYRKANRVGRLQERTVQPLTMVSSSNQSGKPTSFQQWSLLVVD